jgi:hypothetical protein
VGEWKAGKKERSKTDAGTARERSTGALALSVR